MRTLALCAAVLAACTTDAVTPPPLGDYTAWDQFTTWGDAPGHGDTVRVIYVNPIARTNGPLALDAVIVKEIHDDAGDHVPGALRYVAIMRKLRAGPDPTDEGGWLFTRADRGGAAETHDSACWNRCHSQAPLAGIWLDYGALP